jgi:hypothetical protein
MGYKIYDLEFDDWGLRVWGLGLGVWDWLFRFRVWGLGFGIWDLGFIVPEFRI